MREIKFRAWIKDYALMTDVNFLNIDYKEIVVMIDENDYEFGCGEYELMQYTGLKDKNGKEIYEGDIVFDKYANYYTPILQNGIYMAYNVDYLHLTKQEPSTQFNVVWKDGCEVIGNIYENPELLEGKK